VVLLVVSLLTIRFVSRASGAGSEGAGQNGVAAASASGGGASCHKDGHVAVTESIVPKLADDMNLGKDQRARALAILTARARGVESVNEDVNAKRLPEDTARERLKELDKDAIAQLKALLGDERGWDFYKRYVAALRVKMNVPGAASGASAAAVAGNAPSQN
jgi:hypothetical protein